MVFENLKSKNIDQVLLLCILVCSVSISGDLITTYIGLSSGFHELNPIIDFIWSHFGLIGFIIAKLIVVFYIVIGYHLIEESYDVRSGKIYCIFAFTVFILSDTTATLNNVYIIFL